MTVKCINLRDMSEWRRYVGIGVRLCTILSVRGCSFSNGGKTMRGIRLLAAQKTGSAGRASMLS